MTCSWCVLQPTCSRPTARQQSVSPKLAVAAYCRSHTWTTSRSMITGQGEHWTNSKVHCTVLLQWTICNNHTSQFSPQMSKHLGRLTAAARSSWQLIPAVVVFQMFSTCAYCAFPPADQGPIMLKPRWGTAADHDLVCGHAVLL